MSKVEENIELMRKVISLVNNKDCDALQEFYDPDFVDRNPAFGSTSLQEITGYLKEMHEHLDAKITIDDIVAADDKVVLNLTITGKHQGPIFESTPSNNPLSWTAIEIYRIKHGKIVERWIQVDSATINKQLGLA